MRDNLPLKLSLQKLRTSVDLSFPEIPEPPTFCGFPVIVSETLPPNGVVILVGRDVKRQLDDQVAAYVPPDPKGERDGR